MSNLIIVAGLGRCGTSLMMQMLSAAGLKCGGEYPAFEDNRTETVCGEWMDEFEVVKVLDAHRMVFDYHKPATIIWIDRDFVEQARSFSKMMKVFFSLPDISSRAEIRHLAISLKKDRSTAIGKLKHEGFKDIIFTSFEKLLNGEIDIIADRLDLDAEIMRKQIIPRGPRCLPGMLEVQLLEKAEAL